MLSWLYISFLTHRIIRPTGVWSITEVLVIQILIVIILSCDVVLCHKQIFENKYANRKIQINELSSFSKPERNHLSYYNDIVV